MRTLTAGAQAEGHGAHNSEMCAVSCAFSLLPSAPPVDCVFFGVGDVRVLSFSASSTKPNPFLCHHGLLPGWVAGGREGGGPDIEV